MADIRQVEKSKRQNRASLSTTGLSRWWRAGSISARRFRGRRFLIIAILLIVVAGLIIADRRGWLLVRQSDDMAAYHGMSARVIRVIDGDTIEIDLPDSLNKRPATRVHLWGINCPELAHPSSTGPGSAAQPWAAEAAEKTRSLIDDRPIRLYLEAHQTRDPFSAILAHIELPDGTKLNEALLEAGLAKTDDRWPHSMLVRYAQIELNAQRRGVGMWTKSETKLR